MDSNEPVTDLNEQMARLTQRVSDLGEGVHQLKGGVHGLDERVHELKSVDQRITEQGERLGERISKVELELAVIKSNYSTKADVLASRNSVVLWVAGAFFLTQLLPKLLKALGVDVP